MFLRVLRPSKRRTVIWLTAMLLSAALNPTGIVAQDRLGLALAGGGALGFAHVGALQVLEENDIQVDLVSGTSMGSIVGALYAAGYSVDEMLAIVETTNWNLILYDTPRFANLDYRERDALRAYRGRVLFRDGLPTLGSGVSRGQNATEFLDDLLRYYAVTEDFADLPIPLSIVAADLISGEEVVFTSGDIKSAVRASMAVPGIFTPLEYRGRYLIDGGWVNNTPVDRVIELGATAVIAVDLSTPERTRDDFADVTSILEQSSQILRQERTRANLARADIVISPDLRGFTPADFDRADELIALGRAAAERHMAELVELRDLLDQAPRSTRRPVPPESDRTVRIRNVRILPFGAIPPNAPSTFDPYTLIGTELSLREIQRRVYSLYDALEYEYVSYDLVPAGGAEEYDLDLYLVPALPADSVLSVGGGVRAQLLQNVYTRAVVHGNLRNNLSRERYLETDLWLTDIASARMRYHAPVSSSVTLFSGIFALNDPIYFYNDDIVESKYLQYRFGGDAGIELELARNWFASTSAFGEWYRVGREFGAAQVDVAGVPRIGASVQLQRDSLNRPVFPTRGGEVQLAYRARWDRTRTTADNRGEFTYRRYLPLSDGVTLGLRALGGTDFGTVLPLYERFVTGGVELFDGYYFQELRGNHILAGGVDARIALFRLPLGVGERAYLRLGANYGAVWNALSLDEFARRAVFGGKIAVAFDTVLGELNVGIAASDTGRISSFVLLGPAFTASGNGYDW